MSILPNGILRTVWALAMLSVLLPATTGAAPADAPRDKWCSNVHIRFFVGGAEGDAFGTIVYNGAAQAAHDLGAKVEYVYSSWNPETMIRQLRDAIAAKPDGIAMMGHPGNAAIMPLATRAMHGVNRPTAIPIPVTSSMTPPNQS